MKKILFLVVLFCGSLFLSAQNSGKKNAAGIPLKETVWLLESIEGKQIAGTEANKPYIIFDQAGQYYGNFSCNTFFGQYSVRKAKMKLKYSGATKRLCDFMETETSFLHALKKNISNYAINGEVLTLYSGTTPIMVFKKGSKKDTVVKGGDASLETPSGAETDNDKNEREIQRADQENVGE